MIEQSQILVISFITTKSDFEMDLASLRKSIIRFGDSKKIKEPEIFLVIKLCVTFW